MAIKQEYFNINGRDFIRTYSDENRYVVRDGIEYCEANDPAEFNRQYTEGNYMTDDELFAREQEIVNILLGNF